MSEVQEIDINKLNKIRDQWRKQSQNLLLDKNLAIPNETDAPKDARYISDKNRTVEKEQRARQTNVIPKPNSHARPQSHPKTQAQPQLRTHDLSDLGVPMKMPEPKPQADPGIEAQQTPEQEGGDQALNDKNLPEGAENILNTQESVFYSFYARIYEAIAPNWQSFIHASSNQRKLSPGDYTTQADIVLDGQGNLIEIHHLHDSGIMEFDHAVDLSVHKVQRFSNPPRELISPDGYVHTVWSFTVQVGEDFNFNYVPPTRSD